MKKIVLLLAALVLISSLAYADVGVGIWGRTVFILAHGSNPAEGDDAVVYQGWGPDWGGAGGPQMGIAVWWTSDLMEYHFKYKYNNNDAGGAMIPEAWGLLKILPAYGLTVQLGYREEQNDFRETTPTTFHDMNAVNCGRMNGYSAVVMVEPPDMGLKVGLQWRMPLGINIPDPADLDPSDGIDQLTIDMPLQYNIYNIGIGVSYTVPDMVKITVGSMVDNEAWQGDSDVLFPNQTRNIFGRIHLLMVPDLTLWLLAKYTGLEPESVDAEMVDLNGDGVDDLAGPSNDNTVIELLLGAKYVMGDFSIASGIDFKMTTPKADDSISVSDIHANIDPAYNLGNMVVGAVIGMMMQMDDDDVDEGVGLYLEPYVKIPDFNMTIAFKYAMNNDLNPDTDDYSWSIPVQVDFSFW
jgi:hypothetical protein